MKWSTIEPDDKDRSAATESRSTAGVGHEVGQIFNVLAFALFGGKLFNVANQHIKSVRFGCFDLTSVLIILLVIA